jgi:hypothetical protein
VKAGLRPPERASARVYLAKTVRFLYFPEILDFLICSLKHIIYYLYSPFYLNFVKDQ